MTHLQISESEEILKIYGLTPDLIGAEEAGAAAAAEENALAYTNQKIAQLPAPIYPYSHTHWWGTGLIISGSGFTTGASANYQFCRYAFQNPAALLDEVAFYAVLAAGNYRMDVLADRNVNRGIVRFLLNDVAIGTLINYYSSTAVYNVLSSINFSIATPGLQTFKTRVTAKQSASTGYIFAATAIFINPVP
ncbi:MAG TPA: hypothetical protein V6D48_24130 [Oculatellaceae cyanobacterium]